MEHFDNSFLTYFVSMHNWLNQPGYGSLFLLSFLASTLLPLGSEWLLVMMLASGYPPLNVLLTATCGNFLGALTTYLIGILGSQWLITKLLRVSEEDKQRGFNHYQRYGSFTLLFSWLPIIGDPLCLIAGMMRINIWRFSLFVAIGKLLRYAAITWLTMHASA